MLNVFLTWSRISKRGPEAEESFCEQRQISISTLKVTYEAKVGDLHRYLCVFFSFRDVNEKQ